MKYLLSLLLLSFYLHASPFSWLVEREYTEIAPVAVEGVHKKRVVKSVLPDSDGDGILDHKDECPNTRSGEEVNLRGCMTRLDFDNDGIPNVDDKCKNTPQRTEVDSRGCEPDSDNDGVANSKDKCTNTSKDFIVDSSGCPQTAKLKINFASGKYDISNTYKNDLKKFAQFLKKNTGYEVIIYGYTDDIENTSKNRQLSQNRANALKEVLINHRISSIRFTAIGRGKLNPIADNADETGRAQNRRIEVDILQ